MKKKIIFLSILLAVLLSVSILAIVYMKQRSVSEGCVAYIYRDNELIRQIDLDAVKEEFTFTLEYEGRSNTVLVRPGEIGIIAASCPDKLCVKMGFISDSLVPVTCLPNHIVIRVYGKDSSLDDVAR